MQSVMAYIGVQNLVDPWIIGRVECPVIIFVEIQVMQVIINRCVRRQDVVNVPSEYKRSSIFGIRVVGVAEACVGIGIAVVELVSSGEIGLLA